MSFFWPYDALYNTHGYISNRKFFDLSDIPLSTYMNYIHKRIWKNVLKRAQLYKYEQWPHHRILIILLLQRKFEIETKTKWKQFSYYVLQFLKPPSRTPVINPLCSFFGKIRYEDYEESLVYKTKLELLFRYWEHINITDIRDCLEFEPIILESRRYLFCKYMLLYYKTAGEDNNCLIKLNNLYTSTTITPNIIPDNNVIRKNIIMKNAIRKNAIRKNAIRKNVQNMKNTYYKNKKYNNRV